MLRAREDDNPQPGRAMSDPSRETSRQQETPERRARVVRALLVLSPFTFVGCFLLAAVQGARWQDLLLIAVVGTAMCLGAAGLFHLRGSKAAEDVVWINILLRLFGR